MLAGFIAGACEAVVTQPFEVAKTRLQANALVASPRNAQSMAGALRAVVAERGVRGPYLGLPTQLVQTSVKTSLRFHIYTTSKPLLYNSDMLAGLFAGAMEALLWIQPTERIKVLRITNPSRSAVQSARVVFQARGGAFGLWRGGAATVLRNSMTVGMRFSMYEQALAALPASYKKHWATPAVLGFGVGAVSTVLNNPVDVVKTRLNATMPGAHGYAQSVRSMVREGQLMQGVLPRILKISIGQAVTFAVVDVCRKHGL